MSSDLVKRLRETKEDWPANLVYLEQEAADAIEALEGEVRFLRDAGALVEANFVAADSRAEAAEARAERLRDALEFITRGTTGSPDAIVARKATGEQP